MKKLIIANWKMQLNYRESLNLATKFKTVLKNKKSDIVICPDYLALPRVAEILKNSSLKLGAQDSSVSNRGTYTGEVSPLNLKDLGVRYVILGHSERRLHFHETALIVNEKAKAALCLGLIPIVCIGERLSEKEAGSTKKYLETELRRSLKDIKLRRATDLIIAYEPVWAISGQQFAHPLLAAEAQKLHIFIKNKAEKILGHKVKVLYGGSVNSNNANNFLSQTEVDGLLVGGAALNLKSFQAIC